MIVKTMTEARARSGLGVVAEKGLTGVPNGFRIVPNDNGNGGNEMKVVFKRDPAAKDIDVPGSYVIDSASRELVGYFRFERIHSADGVDAYGEYFDYRTGGTVDLGFCSYAVDAKSEVRHMLDAK